ncbi:MAG: aminoacyl-tRNA hydrolase [Clostridia bacterium]
MKVIIGIGNPEHAYGNTYHNIGKVAVDMLAEKLNVKFGTENSKYVMGKIKLNSQDFVLAKSQVYMNLSGDAVLAICTKLRISPKDVIIVTDDIDTPRGKWRFRVNGSGGTHNGLKNIVEKIGTEFCRLKIGTQKNSDIPLEQYVVSKIDSQTQAELCGVINDAWTNIFKQQFKINI